jgi:hypothetical protein
MNEDLSELADCLTWEGHETGARLVRNTSAKLDASHAIVMRVYRELMPNATDCPSCHEWRLIGGPPIKHSDTCLWKSAETLLRKEGLIP